MAGGTGAPGTPRWFPRVLPWGWSTLLLTGGGLLLGCLNRWLLGWFGGGLDGWIRNLHRETRTLSSCPLLIPMPFQL